MKIQVAGFFPRSPKDSSEEFTAEHLATTLEQLAAKIREIGMRDGVTLMEFGSGVAYRIPHDEKTAECRMKATFESPAPEENSNQRVQVTMVL